MSGIHWIQTIIDIALALVVISAFIHQDKLIAWEQRKRQQFARWQKDLRIRLIAAGDAYYGIKPEPLKILTKED